MDFGPLRFTNWQINEKGCIWLISQMHVTLLLVEDSYAKKAFTCHSFSWCRWKSYTLLAIIAPAVPTSAALCYSHFLREFIIPEITWFSWYFMGSMNSNPYNRIFSLMSFFLSLALQWWLLYRYKGSLIARSRRYGKAKYLVFGTGNYFFSFAVSRTST